MADPALIALLAKKAADLAQDKRVRTFIASVISGIIIIILIPLLAVIAIFNTEAGYSREIARIVFDGGPIPSDASEELTQYMKDMIGEFELLDAEIEKINEDNAKELDDIKVKSFFYILYFTEDLTEFHEDFYSGFVECFAYAEDDDEIYYALADYLDYVFTEKDKEEIRSLYLFIKYGFSATDKINGIPGEAFDDETFAKLMEEATKYIGYPYVWGGSSPETSFDCSGFVCWSYTKSGIYSLPRTTAQGIYNQCSSVARDELKPGDLVFFTGTYNSGSPVSHIGIYVGDNQMLHCGDPIGYANLGSSYWIKHFYGYGRLERY